MHTIAHMPPKLLRRDDDELLSLLRGSSVSSAGHAPEIEGFRIIRLIAEGGMGRVYEAEQSHPRRRTAIKLLRTESGQAEHRRGLFRREADALARLQHPDIATVYSAGHTTDGAPYLAMELVHGETLDAHATRRGATTEDALRLMSRICRAVAHAHDQGVIHRDLKPTNILVDAQRNPKVLDFGLARIVTPGAGMNTSATIDGRIAGTLAYMSPEQVSGASASVDARSDVYALGVILYELLTGVLPVPTGDRGFAQIVDDIRRGITIPPTRHRADLHPELERVTLRALEKNPRARYQSAADVADDIDRHLAGLPVSPRPAPWRRYAARAGVALLLLAGLVAGVGAWRMIPAPMPLAHAEAAATPAAAVVHRLAPTVTIVGNLADAEKTLRANLEMIRSSPRTSAQDRGTLVRLALVLERQGRYAEAEKYFRESLEEERPAPYRRAVALVRLAGCRSGQGDHEGADKLFEECRRLASQLGPQRGAIRAEVQVAVARDKLARGLHDEARDLLDRAADSAKEAILNADWARWNVASGRADYFAATGEPAMEQHWRRLAEQAWDGPDVAAVCER